MNACAPQVATQLRLQGCRAEPLGSYLAGLGVFRLVAEQADAEARAHWDGDVLVVTSRLDADRLVHFLLEEYVPSPIVSPWNGGSGFKPSDKGPRERLALLESADTPRLAPYKATIQAARRVVELAGQRGWALGAGSKGKAAKERWVRACRAFYPDEALRWLDVAVVLTGDDLAFPALVGGTGGNFGRLELSATFAGHVGTVLRLGGRPEPPERVRAWMEEVLFGEPAERKSDSAGAFEPVAAGGATAGDSLVNPWGVVLALEGALLFAAAPARRLGARRAAAAAPFATDPSAVGYATASDENVKGEVWAPLWSTASTLGELSRLLGEGRANWRRSQAARGIDFALAAAALGVDRGVNRFVRHAMIERHGQNLLAVPLGRVEVRGRAEVAVAGRLEAWLDSVRRRSERRRSEPPATVRLALGRVDLARWRLANGREGAATDLLIAAARLEAAVMRASGLREGDGIGPVQNRRDGRWIEMDASEWLPYLGDSVELRLAAALASCADEPARRLAFLLRPVERDERQRLVFRSAGPIVPGLETRPLSAVLADVLVARVREVERAAVHEVEATETSSRGVLMRYRRFRPALLADIETFLAGDVNERRLSALLAGCCLLRWDDVAWPEQTTDYDPLPTAYAVLAPFAQPPTGRLLGQNASSGTDSATSSTDRKTGERADEGGGVAAATGLRLRPSWPAALRAGRSLAVLDEALRGLRVAGLDPGVSARAGAGRGLSLLARELNPERLAAALLLPLRDVDVGRLLRQVCPPGIDENDWAAQTDHSEKEQE